VLAEYSPGQRLVFSRNPRYFRKAADGTSSRIFDGITVEIIPDQNAELLRLEAGQIDMMTSEIVPEAYAPMKRAAIRGASACSISAWRTSRQLLVQSEAGRARGDPRATWMQKDELRRRDLHGD